MIYPTLLTLRTRIRTEMDLLDEPAVTDAEINQYLREGVKYAGAKILASNEDYFLDNVALSLSAGVAEVDLPGTIYAQKIRSVIYRNGATVYEIPRLSNRLRMFQNIELTKAFNSGNQDLAYILINKAAAGKVQMQMIPTPTATEANVVEVWFIREPNIMTLDADFCDIPEWEEFVVAFAKHKIATNKPGLADPSITSKMTDQLELAMTNTLSNRVLDEWDLVSKDLSSYEEHS